MTRSPPRDGAPRARRAYRVGPRCRTPERSTRMIAPLRTSRTGGERRRAAWTGAARLGLTLSGAERGGAAVCGGAGAERRTWCGARGGRAQPARPERGRAARAAGSEVALVSGPAPPDQGEDRSAGRDGLLARGR